ncbi:beta-ketoacyl synthase N-terminal-like domain-containing protein [Streptomyces sp. NPDC052107]|uniref:beta-ketoacyl synthase N-terminal-like domain-containing protein n=1 Tax=Streptomyces sp. NPDC052107 TaxID=3155632 RepID=UPI00341D3B93
MNARCPVPAELAVTGVGVVSPWGDDPRTAAAVPSPAGMWFDHRERLGPRGYKYLPPAAQYVLAAGRAALADGGRPDAYPADRRGLLLATNGGLAGLFDSMDTTVVGEGAAGISPASAPYFAVNVLGNRLAAELSLNGFALTVATARTAAVDALPAGALALASGRCDTLVMAAVEEPVPATRGGGGEQGAVAFTLESAAAARTRGAMVRATLRTRSLFVPPAALGGAAGRARAHRALAGALAPLAGPADPPVTVHLDLDSSPVSEAVAAVLSGVPVRPPEPFAADDPAGSGLPLPPRRTGCLGPALAVAQAVTAREGDARLVVCATGAGHVALVRVRPLSPHHTQESQHAETA